MAHGAKTHGKGRTGGQPWRATDDDVIDTLGIVSASVTPSRRSRLHGKNPNMSMCLAKPVRSIGTSRTMTFGQRPFRRCLRAPTAVRLEGKGGRDYGHQDEQSSTDVEWRHSISACLCGNNGGYHAHDAIQANRDSRPGRAVA